MKKVIFIMIASIMAFSVSAQDLVHSKFFDNTFVGASFGFGKNLSTENNPFLSFNSNNTSFTVGVNVGKWITPKFGGEFTYNYTDGCHTNTLGNSSFFGGNFLFNLNNIISGYKGEPRTVEFVPFLGGGYYRTHDVNTHNLAARAGMKFNFNFDVHKQWQMSVVPTINYLLTDDGIVNYPNPQPRFDIRRSWVNLQVGLTYKFKTSNGTHNFKFSDKLYTQEEVDVYMKNTDELMANVNRLRELSEKSKAENEALAQQVNDLNTQIKSLTEKNRELQMVEKSISVIGFEIGKDNILKTQRPSILNIAEYLKNNEDAKVLLTGFADSKTGSEKRNMELSVSRAETVKDELVKLGVNAERIIVEGKGATVQPFSENDANRVVISVIK
jgi:outer membrane protein OmpA-like peptidoglycan-associated protein